MYVQCIQYSNENSERCIGGMCALNYLYWGRGGDVGCLSALWRAESDVSGVDGSEGSVRSGGACLVWLSTGYISDMYKDTTIA